MQRKRLCPRISALAFTLLLIATTTSCGNVDEFVDKAGNVLEDVGDVAKDVGGVVKDAIDEQGGDSASNDESGGQTVSRPPRPTGTLETGSEIPLVSETLGPSGGAVTVNKTGDPLDGLEIKVPSGAYSTPKQFDVSSKPVEGHDFGEYFTPATPLIGIENGGDYSEEFMTVTIPVEVPPDHFAMAFYYDESAGTLEGIPSTGMDNHSITIVTRHFCDIIVSIIKGSVLDDLMKSDIDSHFRPGIDDWQFVNNGSYIAKNGHCAGQCLSALWYFCEQPDGKDLTLNGRYDKNGVKPATPDLWQDDSYGYRLSSAVQGDLADVWLKFENQFFKGLAGADDELAFKAFAYAIQLTGEPQVIYVYSSAGGGHAMVVYRVHKDNLYISDPNYPGNTERRIRYSNGQLEPYESGANRAEIDAGNSTSFDQIGYVAKSASVGWPTIAARWSEFKAGTIGDDRFPQYQIDVVIDENNKEPLVDGYESEYDKIEIEVNAAFPVVWDIYRNGAKIKRDDNWKYQLEDGNNLIGVAIYGDVNNNPEGRKWKYVDFQYFNVQYGESECHGWVLDSIVEKEFVVYDSDEFRSDLVFEASPDGWYSSSGRWVVSKYDGGEFVDVLVDVTHSGSWTALPDCIEPNETVRIEMNCSSSYTTSEPVDWGTMTSHLILSWNNSEIGRINHEMFTTDAPQESTMTAEFTPGEGSPGQYWPPLQIWVGTDSGRAIYEYYYVWQD
ncbi:MAG: hypothetical protein JW846_09845 [Dehalococcoidia bacterium]|nr:hypothetical protein [Dehalococcoidia bacterium]